MRYCMRCGTRLEEDDRFCPVCGLRQWIAPAVNEAARAAGEAIPRPSALLTASLILFFLINPVGTPLAAAAMLLVVLAHSGSRHTAGQLRAAKRLCTVAGAADVLTAVMLLIAALIRLVNGGF